MSSRLDTVIERDGSMCVWCSHTPWRQDLTVEHVLPRSRGGRTTQENLLPACKQCNHRRRSKAATAYARELIRAGKTPDLDLLEQAFARMESSDRRAHRDYAAAQQQQLRRMRSAR
jgi:5-methylcytosine-specific restriction endonuclease McrA